MKNTSSKLAEVHQMRRNFPDNQRTNATRRALSWPSPEAAQKNGIEKMKDVLLTRANGP